MTPVEKIVGYGVSNETASAQSRKHDDAPAASVVLNQTAVADNVGVSRQTVGKTVDRWAKQGYISKETRPSGVVTKEGNVLYETLVVVPAKTSADLYAIASTWVRPEGTPHVGGNGRRCPDCGATSYKRTEETALVRTTTTACAECGHVHDKKAKVIGETTTKVSTGDLAFDIPTAMPEMPGPRSERPVLVQGRWGVSTVDTPSPNPARPPELARCANYRGPGKGCQMRVADPAERYCEYCDAIGMPGGGEMAAGGG